MADELGRNFDLFGTTQANEDGAEIADMLRARRAALEALERELSEFLNDTSR